MLVALAKRYHRWLCETGAKTDAKQLSSGGPTAGLPWVAAIGLVMVICWLIEKSTGQSLWFGPHYLRWTIVAVNLALFAGFFYATFTVLICSWRAERQKSP